MFFQVKLQLCKIYINVKLREAMVDSLSVDTFFISNQVPVLCYSLSGRQDLLKSKKFKMVQVLLN